VDLVTDLVLIYWEVERKVATSRLTNLLMRFQESLTKLYLSILRFLAKASTALHSNTAVRTASNLVRRHDWESQVDDIKDLHQKCENLAKHSISTAEEEGLRKLVREVVDKGFEGTRQAIEEMKKSLQKEHQNINDILNWVSAVDVKDDHQTIRSNMGEYYANRSGIWLREVVDTWMKSETPAFLLTGSGKKLYSGLLSSNPSNIRRLIY
jgi:hypothetical protein